MPRPRIVRIDLDDPEQMAQMLRSGAVWRKEQFWPDAIRAVKAGLVPLNECKDIPPQAMELIRGR